MTLIPTLTTERLVLRAPRIWDFDAHAAFRASERAAHVGGPDDRTAAWAHFAAMAGQWVLRGYGRWVVADGRTDDALGVVGLHHPDDWPEPELAWTVYADAEGRGIAREAAEAARAHAYEALGWTTLMSFVAPGNRRSVALAERMGCTPGGHFDHPSHGRLAIMRHPGPDAGGDDA